MTRGFAVPVGTEHHFRAQGIKVVTVDLFGPQGATWKLLRVTPLAAERGSMIATQAVMPDGEEWLHASIAWENRDPSYAELTMMKAVVFGRRRWAYQVLPPASEHVNIHEHALHLYGRVDGTAALPDFTFGRGSI